MHVSVARLFDEAMKKAGFKRIPAGASALKAMARKKARPRRKVSATRRSSAKKGSGTQRRGYVPAG